MQLVNSSTLQQQVISPQPRMPDNRERSLYPAKTPLRGNEFIFLEDVVTLSTDRSSIPDSSVSKRPSTPVTQAEKMALQDTFSVYA